MPRHRAYGLGLRDLDVVIIDDTKPMQSILRSILAAVHVARVRVFDNADAAMQAMLVEPPNLVLCDWRMRPTDGLGLVRAMRQRGRGALALVPVILITAYPTRTLVEAALAAGAHFVVAKPISPAVLIRRIQFVLGDGRQFGLLADGRTVVLERPAGLPPLRRRAAMIAVPRAVGRGEPPFVRPGPVALVDRPRAAATSGWRPAAAAADQAIDLDDLVPLPGDGSGATEAEADRHRLPPHPVSFGSPTGQPARAGA
jgi:two-component system chemotaxis response regulator CheY